MRSGYQGKLRPMAVLDSRLSVASDWPPAFFEREVFVVAALNAVVWVTVSPLRFACVATLGAVHAAFWFAAMMCFQRFVTGALMELAWETDHDDQVSTSAGTENASIGNVFEMKGRRGVDLGLNSPRCWAFLVASGAAVAFFFPSQDEMLSVFLRSLGSPWCGFGKWKKRSALSGKEKNNDDLLQASTLAEAYECISFKGKDKHDADGSLSLGSREASGRVDVPVSVGALLSAEKFCRSGQSVALVTPCSCVAKTIFVKEVDGNGSTGTLLWETCGVARRICGSRTKGRRFNLVTPYWES